MQSTDGHSEPATNARILSKAFGRPQFGGIAPLIPGAAVPGLRLRDARFLNARQDPSHRKSHSVSVLDFTATPSWGALWGGTDPGGPCSLLELFIAAGVRREPLFLLFGGDPGWRTLRRPRPWAAGYRHFLADQRISLHRSIP